MAAGLEEAAVDEQEKAVIEVAVLAVVLEPPHSSRSTRRLSMARKPLLLEAVELVEPHKQEAPMEILEPMEQGLRSEHGYLPAAAAAVKEVLLEQIVVAVVAVP